jgi:hypothetical protein
MYAVLRLEGRLFLRSWRSQFGITSNFFVTKTVLRNQIFLKKHTLLCICFKTYLHVLKKTKKNQSAWRTCSEKICRVATNFIVHNHFKSVRHFYSWTLFAYFRPSAHITFCFMTNRTFAFFVRTVPLLPRCHTIRASMLVWFYLLPQAMFLFARKTCTATYEPSVI